MSSDLFLSDAGFLFFAFWSLILGAVSLAAFGRDLLPSKVPVDPSKPSGSPQSALPPSTRQ
jgi:hypothetical protein